ncbi:hypothetical protein IWW50_005879, partial [Coemansia erecta]
RLGLPQRVGDAPGKRLRIPQRVGDVARPAVQASPRPGRRAELRRGGGGGPRHDGVRRAAAQRRGAAGRGHAAAGGPQRAVQLPAAVVHAVGQPQRLAALAALAQRRRVLPRQRAPVPVAQPQPRPLWRRRRAPGRVPGQASIARRAPPAAVCAQPRVSRRWPLVAAWPWSAVQRPPKLPRPPL